MGLVAPDRPRSALVGAAPGGDGVRLPDGGPQPGDSLRDRRQSIGGESGYHAVDIGLATVLAHLELRFDSG